MTPPSSIEALLRAVFRLEGERTLALARLGRDPGAEVALEDVDARLGDALARLEARGVAYPAHDVARRYAFSIEDYLLLQLALARWHGDEATAELTSLLGDPGLEMRLSHAIGLLRPGFDDWTVARAQLEAFRVVTERLVVLAPRPDGDPAVTLGPALVELLGLSPR